MILEGEGKNTVFVENRDFSHISLCAKFNRFFIILGGVGNRPKPRFLVVLGVWRGPIYWDLDQKTPKNADEVSGFLEVFLIWYIRGIGPDIRGFG